MWTTWVSSQPSAKSFLIAGADSDDQTSFLPPVGKHNKGDPNAMDLRTMKLAKRNDPGHPIRSNYSSFLCSNTTIIAYDGRVYVLVSCL